MSEYRIGQMKDILTLADSYAKNHSTCRKTAVGCYLVKEDAWRTVLSKGANCGEDNCKEIGCLREELFGSNSKKHRDTCRCHHSEIDALSKVKNKDDLKGATAFVTRYPCHNCTQALLEAGIKRVVYGRPFEMEKEDVELLKRNNVEVIHISDWNCDEEDINN